MNRFVLDTCFLSELMRQRPDARITTWLTEQDEAGFLISVVVLGELEKGVHKLADDSRRKAIREWLDGPFMERFADRIVPVDAAVARQWGRILGENARRGVALPVVDAILAATALVHDAAVVTRNVGDLERCGARVVNPWG